MVHVFALGVMSEIQGGHDGPFITKKSLLTGQET